MCTRKHKRHFILSVVILILLPACGGGGGGGGGGAQNPPATYSVGGSISGLEDTKSLVLDNNGIEQLTISQNGDFTFATSFLSGDSYTLQIANAPEGENCRFLGGTENGVIVSSDVSDVSIYCSRHDFSFSGGGYVRTYIGSSIYEDVAESIVVQPDGKLLLVGYSSDNAAYDYALARFNPDGYLDDTLGGVARFAFDVGSNLDFAHDAKLQSDGKIIIAGSSWNGYKSVFTLVRFLSNGSLDTTFGTNGIVTTLWDVNGNDSINAVAIQADDKIVAVGTVNNKIAIVRYNADGSLDSSFGGSGINEATIYTEINAGTSVVIQPDGKIVVAGYTANASLDHDFFVMRITTTGTADTSFNQSGVVTTDIGGDMYSYILDAVIQSDGKILVAGYSNKDFALARYNIDGSLDAGFNGAGTVKTPIGTADDVAYSVAIQNDGKIVAGGYSWGGVSLGNDFALVRYNSDGSLDPTFGGGKLTYDLSSGNNDSIKDIALTAEGKIVAVGYSEFNNADHFAIAVYLP
jgi:uncharacterized delta-60 repeat protein